MQQPTKRFAIIGFPIQHSLSPFMHNTAFADYHLPYQYDAIGVKPSKLEITFKKLVKDGYAGFNVTIPFKESIRPFLKAVSPEAQAIGAVNTIEVRSDGLFGHNTDTIGVFETLKPFGSDINGSNIFVLGAGGAARAVVHILARQFKPQQITIAARSASRAEALSKLILSEGNIKFVQTDFREASLNFYIQSSKMIINTTPIGMHPNNNASPIPPNAQLNSTQILYDVIYHPLRTKFLKQGIDCGARIIDGLTMFIHQGAEAFRIWTGFEMSTEKMHSLLVEQLSHSS